MTTVAYIFRVCILQLVILAQFCSVLFNVLLHDLGGVNQRLVWQLYNRDMYCYKDYINVICELLAVKHGDLEIDLFNNLVWVASIEVLLNFAVS